MAEPDDKALRARLYQEIVQLMQQLDPISDELAAITKKAQAEGWDIATYEKARAPLAAVKARIAAEVKQRQQTLAAPAAAPAPEPTPSADPPTFARFARAHGQALDVLANLDAALGEQWDCVIRRVVRLAPSGQTDDGGLRFAGEEQTCAKFEEARTRLRNAQAFALVYLARVPQALFTLFVFDTAPDAFCVSLDMGPRILRFRNDKYAPGRWAEAFLLEIIRGLGSQICSYGTTPAGTIIHKPIEVAEFLAALRDGSLLGSETSTLHVVSTALIGKAEIDAALSKHEPKLEYRMAPGFHIIGRIEAPE